MAVKRKKVASRALLREKVVSPVKKKRVGRTNAITRGRGKKKGLKRILSRKG